MSDIVKHELYKRLYGSHLIQAEQFKLLASRTYAPLPAEGDQPSLIEIYTIIQDRINKYANVLLATNRSEYNMLVKLLCEILDWLEEVYNSRMMG